MKQALVVIPVKPRPTTVYIVDDDPAMRESLTYLLEAEGFRVSSYKDASEFLCLSEIERPSCLLLDLRLGDTDGLVLREEWGRRGITLPTIMISGQSEIPDVVRAMKQGVLDFLTKPFSDSDLFEAIRQAVTQDERLRLEQAHVETVRAQISALSQRERGVMERVIQGKVNKKIAAELKISVKTVEYHRKRLMEKLSVESVPELVRRAVIAYPDEFRYVDPPTQHDDDGASE